MAGSVKVLITDGNTRPALAATRSLAQKGYDVIIASDVPKTLAGVSKYCRDSFLYPAPNGRNREFIECIKKEIERRKIDIVIPITEVSAYLLLQERRALESVCHIPFPNADVFDLVSDKIQVAQLAQKLGLPIPRTVLVESAGELFKLIRDLYYPVVVKPSRSRILKRGRWVHGRVRYARDIEELKNIVEEERALQDAPFMIQEFIEGEGRGVFTLYNQGKPLVFFSHRRIREKPPFGGVSVLCESVPLDTRMKDYAEKLLSKTNWHGVAMVEFKVCRRTGIPYLMEVNGRFWGSLHLAIQAGIDFPHLLCQMALSRKLPTSFNYKSGIRSRWLLGDLDNLYLTLMSKEIGPYKIKYLDKVKRTIDFLNIFQKNTKYDIWDWRDPRPFWYELTNYIRGTNA